MSLISSLLFFLCNPSAPLIPERAIEPYKAPAYLKASLDAVFEDSVFKDAFLQKNNQALASLGCTVVASKWGHIAVIHPKLPDYIIKGEKPYQNKSWKRVFYGQELKKAIGDNQDLCIPTEYLYQYPGQPSTPDSANYCVISKKVTLKENSLATFLVDKPELLKDIQTMMKTAGYWNPGIADDIRVTTQGKVLFTNTELYPEGYNIILQSILNLIFFRLQPRGVVTAKKLALLVEKAKNPSIAKKRSVITTLSICGAALFTAYVLTKVVQNKL